MPLHTEKPGYYGKALLKSTEGRTRRLAIAADRLVTQPFDGVYVIPDVLDDAARTYGSRNAIGWRNVVDVRRRGGEEDRGRQEYNREEEVEILRADQVPLTLRRRYRRLCAALSTSALSRAISSMCMRRRGMFTFFVLPWP